MHSIHDMFRQQIADARSTFPQVADDAEQGAPARNALLGVVTPTTEDTSAPDAVQADVSVENVETTESTTEPADDAQGDAETGENAADEQTDTASFDPSAHSVAEVIAYADEHPDETDAILAAERDGKNRSTILNALAS